MTRRCFRALILFTLALCLGASRVSEHSLAAASGPLFFSTYLGKGGDDGVSAVRIGPDGAMYVTGTTSSPKFPTTPGAFDRTYNSHDPGFDGDAFVAKFSADGSTLIYSTFLGGFDSDYGIDLAVGPGGEVYVVGYTYSNDFPTTPGAWSPEFNGGCCDVFIAKLNASGSSLIYSTFVGGDSFEAASAMALDPNGRVYLTGETLSDNFPTTPGAYDRINESPLYSDAFATALSADGSQLVFSTFLGGKYNDYGEGLGLGPDSSVTVGGRTQSPNFPTTSGAYDRTHNGGGGDAFVTRLNALGQSLIFSTYLGGFDDDSVTAVAVDDAGATYLTGSTVSPNFPTTPGASQRKCGSCARFLSDAFVTRLRPSGAGLGYSTFLGGNDTDFGRRLALGSERSVYVVGTTLSSNFPTTANGFDTTLGGCCDAFVTHIGRGATLRYGTFLGGAGVPPGLTYEFGVAIAAAGSDLLYIAGVTGAADFPTTPGSYDRTYAANDDGFITALRLPSPP